MKSVVNIVIKKLYSLFLLFIGISLISFTLMNFIPGDAASITGDAAGESATRESLIDLRKTLDMDKPYTARYILWLGHVLTGDFGVSLRSGEPVSGMLARAIPVTFELAIVTFAFIVTVSLATGTLSVIERTGRTNRVFFLLASISSSVPLFIIAPFLMYGRVIHSSLDDILQKEYIRAAVARGISRKRIIMLHAMKNALVPAATLWTMSLGRLMGGAVIIETIFSWPGVGRMTVDAIFNRDYPVVMACIMSGTFLYIAVITITDLILSRVHPGSQT